MHDIYRISKSWAFLPLETDMNLLHKAIVESEPEEEDEAYKFMDENYEIQKDYDLFFEELDLWIEMIEDFTVAMDHLY